MNLLFLKIVFLNNYPLFYTLVFKTTLINMKKKIIFFIIPFMLLNGLNIDAQIISLLPVPQKITLGKSKFQVAGAKVLN